MIAFNLDKSGGLTERFCFFSVIGHAGPNAKNIFLHNTFPL